MVNGIKQKLAFKAFVLFQVYKLQFSFNICHFNINNSFTYTYLCRSFTATLFVRKSWWKILSLLILVYTVIAGFTLPVPNRPIIHESIRNMYFHVCMWFGMMLLFIISLVYAVKYLRSSNLKDDIFSNQFAAIGTWFGILGYGTGAIWANYTWITDQSQTLASVLKEPKLIGAAIAVLTYCAYFVLRGSFTDMDKRARASAVYNIFAFAMLLPSIWIIPRMVQSLHPGGQGGEMGNPALNAQKDLDILMRAVFYPAVIGWTLLGVWIATLRIRIQLIKDKNLLHG